MVERKSPPRRGLTAMLIAAGVLSFGALQLIEIFRVPSGAMIPSVVPGQSAVVSRFAYLFSEPQRGDIAVFLYPKDESKKYLKRIVGLPGDRVQLKGRTLTINGTVISSSDTSRETYEAAGEDIEAEGVQETLDTGTYTVLYDPRAGAGGCEFGCESPFEVPEGHLFVLGDNRDNSSDSRIWGTVEIDKLRGRFIGPLVPF